MASKKDHKISIKEYGLMNWYMYHEKNHTPISYLITGMVCVITSVATIIIARLIIK